MFYACVSYALLMYIVQDVVYSRELGQLKAMARKSLKECVLQLQYGL